LLSLCLTSVGLVLLTFFLSILELGCLFAQDAVLGWVCWAGLFWVCQHLTLKASVLGWFVTGVWPLGPLALFLSSLVKDLVLQ
jgi:hypothetical protein